MKEGSKKTANEAKWPWETPAPATPNWFAKPVPVEIPAEIELYPFFEEAEARIIAGGLDKSVLVPAYAVDEERQIVKGALVAETGDSRAVLVYFAPTCLGSERITIDRQTAAEWARKGAGNHAVV